MIKGGYLIFTSLLSVCFLKRKLDMHNFAGILLTLAGITLIGYAAFINRDS
jgi:uncharacterized membrane protein